VNSILLSIGIAIALALVAAFAAPFFIDWSSYRGYFEARASEIIGRKVVFAGELDVRLVPFPRLAATDVRIGDAGGGEGAESVEIHAALTPLLSGELLITGMTVRRPFAVVGLDASGRLVWSNDTGPSVPFAPERVRIDRFEIVDGALDVDDDQAGRTIHLTGINLGGSATSLIGPFRAEGGLVADGRRLTLRLATGRLQEERGGIRMKLSLLPADAPLGLELDGTLVRDPEAVPIFTGMAVLERLETDDGALPWRIDAQVSASPEHVVVDKGSLRIGPEVGSVTFAGAVNIDLGARPRFDAVLSARQLDLDRLLGSGAEQPVDLVEVVRRIGAALEPELLPIPGHAAIDIESVVLSGGLVEALSVDLAADGGGLAIERAVAAAPGGTDVSMAGRVIFDSGSPRFDGAIRVNAAQAPVFGDWLLGPNHRLPAVHLSGARLTASARVMLGDGRIVAESIDIATADTRLQGAVGFWPRTETTRGRLSAQLTADRLALAVSSGPGGPDRSRLLGAAAATVEGIDVDIELAADALALGDVEASGVVAELAIADGDLTIRRLTVGDIGGARVEGSGAVRSFAKTPDGSLTLAASAEALDGVARLLSALGYRASGDWLSARGAELVPARLEANVHAVRTADGSRIRLDLTGVTGGTDIRAEASFEGAVEAFHAAAVSLDAQASNPDGARLAAQVGLEPTPGQQPGRIAIRAEGRPEASISFDLEAAGIGIDGTFVGSGRWPQRGGREITGKIAGRVSDPGRLLRMIGLDLSAPPAQPLQITAGLSATDDIWSVSGLELAADGVTAAGRISLDAGAGMWVLDGELQTNRLDLPWLLGLAVGEAGREIGRPGIEAAWPEAPFEATARPGWRGRVSVATPVATLFPGARLTDARLEVGFDAVRFSVDNIVGNLFGGRLQASLDLIELDGTITASGRVELSNARLEEFVWSDGRRPVATGAVSFGAAFEGAGRSPLALVSALSGTGSFGVTNGVLRRMNPAAFDLIISAADAGLELTEERVGDVFAGHLDAGSLAFESIEGAFSISSGVLRANNVRIRSEALSSFASATIDLGELAIDSEWTLRLEADGGDSRVREVGVVFAGPLAHPQRLIDVNPLLGYLTVRAFEQEVERLEALQAEILERQRLGRELIRQGQERVRREREAAEEAQRRAEEAARQSEEEARRLQAEEEQRRQAEQRDRRSQSEEPAPEPSAEETQPADELPQAAGTQLDNSEFTRRIEEILRELPPADSPPPGSSASDGLPSPSGPVTTDEQSPTDLPPIGQPIVITPAPVVPLAPVRAGQTRGDSQVVLPTDPRPTVSGDDGQRTFR